MPLLMLHFHYMLLIIFNRFFFLLSDKPTRDIETTNMVFPLPGETVDEVKKIDSNIILSFLLRYKLHYSNLKLYKGLLKSVRISQRIN